MCVTTFRLLHQLGPRISQSVPHLGSSSALRARSEARKSRWVPKGCRARGLATILSSKLLSLVVASELLRTPGPVRILFEPDQREDALRLWPSAPLGMAPAGVTANLADFLLVSPVRDLSVVVSAVDRWGIDVSAVGWRPCSSVLAVSSGSRAGLGSGRGGAAWPLSGIRVAGCVLG